MIKLKQIDLGFMEGKTGWGNKTFKSFEEFQAYMRSRAFDIRIENQIRGQEWLGYYKGDVTVIWENGDSFKLRYDLGQDGLSDGRDLAGNIRSLCKFYLGEKPYWMDDRTYKEATKNVDKARIDFFTKVVAHYELA